MRTRGWVRAGCAVLLVGYAVSSEPVYALGTGFTFQGQLQQSGIPQNGTCDLQFSLFNALSGGTKLGSTQTVSSVTVVDGLLTVTLNGGGEFGATAFDGTDRWLEIAVRCPAGSGVFSAAFVPRQPLTAAPYALYAAATASAADLNCTGCVGGTDLANDSVTSNKILDGSIATADLADSAVTSAKIADGTVTGVDLANAAVTPQKIQPGTNGQVLSTVAGAVAWQTPSGGGAGWSLTGNSGTNTASNFIGTTDLQALEVRVNNSRVLRFEPSGSLGLSPNVLGGDFRNYVATGVQGATMSGGGRGVPQANRVLDSFGTIGGGEGNKAGNGDGPTGDGDVDNASYATVGGGSFNFASGQDATVAGGASNQATGNDSVVSGGTSNVASGDESTISGGTDNTASAQFSLVSGGMSNTASMLFATVGGGTNNTASGGSATVAGGSVNMASAATAVVGGGASNTASAQSATVSGGEANAASGTWSTIGGGLFNQAPARLTTIGGGGTDAAGTPSRANFAYDEFGTIGGGTNNQVGINDADTTTQSAATIGGGSGNRSVATLATIGGGGGTGTGNTVYDTGGTIGGGSRNTVGRNDGGATMETSQLYATIGGGGGNRAFGRYSTVSGGGGDSMTDGNSVYDAYGTIAGGQANNAGIDDASQFGQAWATVGGGFTNRALATAATVAGGYSNQATGQYSFVGSGNGNIAAGNSAMIVGGSLNSANGSLSFAAGHRAVASNDGCFVWGDSTEADVTCTVNNRFVARAAGGVQFFSNGTATSGVQLLAGSGSWSTLSDRAAKEHVAPIDGRDVLAKLAATPIRTWNYKSQDPSIRHIGPMAQDFYAAFHVGEDTRLISNVDADGVALAALQGVHSLLGEKDAQIAALTTQLHTLERRLASLEARIDSDSQPGKHTSRRRERTN